MTKTQLSPYGLPPEDEFYDLDFIQVSDEGSIEVRPYTYTLMTWWKVRMDQSDSIDINPNGMSSMLNFESSVTGGNSNISVLSEEDEFTVDNIIEVDEENGQISFYIYMQQPIPEEYAPEVAMKTLNVNPLLQYGHFEIYHSDEDKNHYLRYRSSVILNGVLVGKVNTLQNMIEHSQYTFSLGINAMCNEDEKFTKFVLNVD